jgi:hypothetical protein
MPASLPPTITSLVIGPAERTRRCEYDRSDELFLARLKLCGGVAGRLQQVRFAADELVAERAKRTSR